jgi:pyruvate/2-oxoglutarate dehydrogenase complex dihydrolipoamide dehydrogenase (E3) component
MERVQRVIRTIEPHDSVERYDGLGRRMCPGRSKDRFALDRGDSNPDGERTKVLTTRSIIIAAGGRPLVPPIPGIEETGYLTSDTLWALRELPRRLVVLGGGPIGCELAQAFQRLGSQVTQVEMLPRLLVREDPEVAALVESACAPRAWTCASATRRRSSASTRRGARC